MYCLMILRARVRNASKTHDWEHIRRKTIAEGRFASLN